MTAWLLAISITSNVLALALPLALLQVYDRIIPSQEFGTATVLFVGVLVAILLDATLRFARGYAIGRVSLLREYGATHDLSRRILGTDVVNLRALGPGALRSALMAVAQSRDLDGPASRVPFFDSPFVVVFLALVWLLGGWLAIIPLATLVVCSLAAMAIASRQRATTLRRSRAEQQSFSALADLLAGFVDLKSFGYAARLVDKAVRPARRYAEESERFEREASYLTDLSQVAALATTVATALIGSVLVVGGALTTGGLAACTMLGGRAVGSGLAIFAAIARRGAAEAAREEVAALRERVRPGEGAVTRTDNPIGLVFEAVSFDRPGMIIPPLSAQAPAGSLVQVRSRKRATEVLLLFGVCGLEEPTSGTISARWRDGGVGALASARCLTEKPSLFAGTILDNMTGWDTTRHAEAAELARDLGLAALIDRLPEGFMTRLSGTLLAELSAGLVKRIALVRTLAGGGPVICLDYPEVDLDVDGRARLAAWLNEKRGERIILLTTGDPRIASLCTHRLDLDPAMNPVALPEAAE